MGGNEPSNAKGGMVYDSIWPSVWNGRFRDWLLEHGMCCVHGCTRAILTPHETRESIYCGNCDGGVICFLLYSYLQSISYEEPVVFQWSRIHVIRTTTSWQ